MSSKKYGRRFHKGISSYRVPEELSPQVVEAYLSALDCPRALTVLILYRNMEHEQLAKLEFDPLSYDDLVTLRDSYCATKFLSKFKGLTLSYDLDEVALQKFESFELLCRGTNYRFRSLQRDCKFSGRVVWLHTAVIRKIERILGDFSVDEFFSTPDWGPGASTLIKRRDASPAIKFRLETGVTRDLYDLVPWETLRVVYPNWSSVLVDSGFPNFQVGNKVITVPKDATTNRVIAIEPGINLWFQKALGNMIGLRLLRRGVDLRFQVRNQQLAKKGSIDSSLATVDLSSASDSISVALVEELLPPRWFAVMDACRSHYGALNGSVRKWEKFSSMGNGFTFQLESLIFYAAASVCAEYQHVSSTDVSAYGDDVILPSACFELFSELIEFYGFKLNEKKSHVDSLFRESCGAHFFSGIDVKPIYLKDRVSSVHAVYRLANAIRRLAHNHNVIYGCDSRFQMAFDLLVNSVPKSYRFRIPNGLGDGGFISNFDEASPKTFGHGIEGYRVQNVVEVSKTYLDETVGYLLASLWSLKDDEEIENISRNHIATVMSRVSKTEREEDHLKLKAMTSLLWSDRVGGRNTVPLRGRVTSKLVNSLSQQWYDLGPWI